ncbi:hypothetical protein [Rhizobium rhizogenes]|uniref:Uncharacterized protein n=1 Tax=Rhizobium rhizogenes TaxID=359 RepID=A0AA92C331_RHIRH|nr:hypothetical protein [Rhizobium rhizogenes]PVE54012.1 hypothetical protein DC430_12225 [Rhizobium rhizogenes]PVE66503.1 hypothetical protein DC415_08840 [Agrobacterium tumefaciens]PVE76491.1 hypothetical protein DCP16_08840 [Sphingomonas sp. TPD3009]
MQDDEGDDIFILIVDETYGGDEETYICDSDNYRRQLEQDFQVSFAPANIGAGADIPAFVTIIATAPVPVWAIVLSLFFLGKPINENLAAWGEIAAALRRFFSRPVVLSRHGAATLAVEAVVEEIGGLPKLIRLLSYRAHYAGFDDKLSSLPNSREIEASPPVLNLGHTQHVFEIEVDGIGFRVGVSGKNVEVVRIERAT